MSLYRSLPSSENPEQFFENSYYDVHKSDHRRLNFGEQFHLEQSMAEDGLETKCDSSSSNEKIRIHNFSASLLDSVVHFHVMKMQESLFMWIGRKPELANLSVAMCTKYETTPAVANLMGDVSEITSNTLAKKIARKSKKQCFVSYNLPPENALLELVERRLIREMTDNPDQF